VHLTVGVVRYDLSGRPRKGVASTYLADRVLPRQPVRVFIHPSRGFAPPDDPTAPMIMVGPGTGIAPFRAFLQDRKAAGAAGRNWLFFGDQRRACDFLYQDELEQYLHDGLLTRLDTAFSRDGDAKVYVQHRMMEHGAELWAWLEEGGHFYVCGDAKRMAADVDRALHQVIETFGGKSAEDAKTYVKQMSKAKRYQRDVY
jgi:sulfite reductase (NADPH) flavoprotein alpha-component